MNKKKKMVNKKHRRNIDRIRRIRLNSNAAVQKAKKKDTTEKAQKKAGIKAEKIAPDKSAVKKPAAIKAAAPKKPGKKAK